jgi:hypothetical protein
MIQYASLDAAGEPVGLPVGQAFTTHWVLVADAQEAAWTLTPVGELARCEVQHPWDALDRYGPEELARFAISAEEVADPAPPLPTTVPMYKVKKFLAKTRLEGGPDLHAAIIAHLETLPEPHRTLALIDFGGTETTIGSPNFVVASPLVQGAKAALGLSDAAFDGMVLAAAAIA